MSKDTEQVHEAIEKHLLKTRKLPTAQELADQLGVPRTVAGGHLTQYKAHLQTLYVHPDGKIYTSTGEQVWRQNSGGSLTLACLRKDKTLGLIVYG